MAISYRFRRIAIKRDHRTTPMPPGPEGISTARRWTLCPPPSASYIPYTVNRTGARPLSRHDPNAPARIKTTARRMPQISGFVRIRHMKLIRKPFWGCDAVQRLFQEHCLCIFAIVLPPLRSGKPSRDPNSSIHTNFSQPYWFKRALDAA